MTICQSVIGFVFNISIVPDLNSSEKLRMVMAGTKNKKNQGAIKKKLFKSAKPAFRILKSPLNTHKNSPLTTKKTAITK